MYLTEVRSLTKEKILDRFIVCLVDAEKEICAKLVRSAISQPSATIIVVEHFAFLGSTFDATFSFTLFRLLQDFSDLKKKRN